MKPRKILKILSDNAYVRAGGTEAELRAAQYLACECEKLGHKAEIVPFDVDMAEISKATLTVDGREIPCTGYFGAGSGEIEAPLYYLRDLDEFSLSQCKGKIALIEGHMRHWMYQDLLRNGAVGFVTFDGDINTPNPDIDERELRRAIHQGNPMLGVNIHIKSAVELVKKGAKDAHITLRQTESVGQSHNVILELPGQIDEWITLSAHYDSVRQSIGVYDNFSGSVGLLGIAEYFTTHPHRYSLRFLWCGSEERGLLGSKAYCAANPEQLEKTVLNINLDMIGCIMGKFAACCTAEEALVNYIHYFAMERGCQIKAYQDVYSSDSTPFADSGVPAVSFARWASRNCAPIHNRYDTMAVMSGEQMARDIELIIAFTDRMANAAFFPVKKEIPANVKEKLDVYLTRKRPEQK
ncbi:MAG: M28 family metallopeptidase [Firmicutes bacterium]|nr:M28 family metallopeptidase [Bacillota bacterium]